MLCLGRSPSFKDKRSALAEEEYDSDMDEGELQFFRTREIRKIFDMIDTVGVKMFSFLFQN